MKRYTFLFFILLIITAIIIVSPVLIKFDTIKLFVDYYLSDLHSMKGDYLAMLGALIGSCLAITGALWTQRKINNITDLQNTKKLAQMVFFDMRRIITYVKSSYISNSFNFDTVKWRLKLCNNWDENIISIGNNLTLYELDTLYKLFDDAYVLSSLTDKLIDSSNEIEESKFDFQSGVTSTTMRNKTTDEYNVESKKLVTKLAQNILSKEFINEISVDIELIEKSHKYYYEKEKKLNKFREDNHIHYFIETESINSEILKKYKQLSNDIEKAKKNFLTLKSTISKKWQNKLNSPLESNQINHQYLNLNYSISERLSIFGILY